MLELELESKVLAYVMKEPQGKVEHFRCFDLCKEQKEVFACEYTLVGGE